MNPTESVLDLRVSDAVRIAGGSSELLALLVREDFAAFAHMTMSLLLGSDAPRETPWHVRAMASVVEDIERGDRRRVIVTVPPRHLKSTVMTVAQIAWRLG